MPVGRSRSFLGCGFGRALGRGRAWGPSRALPRHRPEVGRSVRLPEGGARSGSARLISCVININDRSGTSLCSVFTDSLTVDQVPRWPRTSPAETQAAAGDRHRRDPCRKYCHHPSGESEDPGAQGRPRRGLGSQGGLDGFSSSVISGPLSRHRLGEEPQGPRPQGGSRPRGVSRPASQAVGLSLGLFPHL